MLKVKLPPIGNKNSSKAKDTHEYFFKCLKRPPTLTVNIERKCIIITILSLNSAI